MTETDNDALADGDGLARDQYQTLRGTTYRRVHDAILADIVKGSFTPGARLKIADLCRRYGLSPMPIREALQQLQGEGIVVMEPNKGAKVRTIDRNFIADIYDVRGALYAIVYRDVIATADSAFDDRLVAIQQGFDQMGADEAGSARHQHCSMQVKGLKRFPEFCHRCEAPDRLSPTALAGAPTLME